MQWKQLFSKTNRFGRFDHCHFVHFLYKVKSALNIKYLLSRYLLSVIQKWKWPLMRQKWKIMYVLSIMQHKVQCMCTGLSFLGGWKRAQSFHGIDLWSGQSPKTSIIAAHNCTEANTSPTPRDSAFLYFCTFKKRTRQTKMDWWRDPLNNTEQAGRSHFCHCEIKMCKPFLF